MSRQKIKVESIVAWQADPECRGRVLRISRNGKVALVQFDDYPRTDASRRERIDCGLSNASAWSVRTELPICD
ncbi:hypothetical protein MYX84_09140 [Acidobacteria bacterium AH-259-O06]|nr:hypothetical protein [Acidobacteria bacterium AH-259-O06]